MDPRRSTSSALLIVLSLGLALRLLLAYVLLPASGAFGDLDLYVEWALTLSSVGPGEFYAKTSFADYPPGYLYVLWLIGAVSQAIASVTHASPAMVAGSLMKIPPILLDVLAACLLYQLARSYSADRTRAERTALTAAAIYIFNPVVWYNSAIWGQTDVAGACALLAGLIALIRWPSEAAAGIAVLAVLIKPQFGVILGPLIGVVLLHRYLWSHRSGTAAPAVERFFWLRLDGPIRLLSSTLAGILVFYALVTPFALDLHAFLTRLVAASNVYHFLSVNAYNPWALVGSGGTPAMAFGAIDMDGWSLDDIPLVGSLTGAMIGASLLGVAFLVGIARLAWRPDRWSVALVGAYMSLSLFMLPTRIHERYLFAAFAFTSILAAFDRRWLYATIVLTLAAFMNLHGVLTLESMGTPNITRLPLGEAFRSHIGILVSIGLHTAVFLFAIWSLRPKALRSSSAPSQIEAHSRDIMDPHPRALEDRV